MVARNLRWSVRWLAFSFVTLVVMLPLLGLLGPQPGAPLGQRSLGVGSFWLTRIVESSNAAGGSWHIQTNWPAIVACSATMGLVMVACARLYHSFPRERKDC